MDEALRARLDLPAGLAAVKNCSQHPAEEVRVPLAPHELAQDIMVRLKPAELPLLKAHMDGRPAVRRPRRRFKWFTLTPFGSGGPAEVVALLAPVVAAVAVEVVRYFTAEVLESRADRRRDRVRERSDEVRRIVRETAGEAGLPEERLEELADAVLDALDDSTD
ncbi:hypothetical protein [Streptomyces neyagawaensis]|uniref:hypothetical protein n=1 Tax=Streptomyces neyagawaensis TaxID=42238 RepID=UPI0012FF2108|nr:hypothetical protein [Streptomyces neyagawaensis]